MTERDVFEARLARAVDAFADRAYTVVDPAAVTRQAIGHDHPQRIAITMPRLAPAWMLLLAVGLLIAGLAASLFMGSRPQDIVTDAGDVLATTIAGPTPPQAVCPPGSDPDVPGPAGQERPPVTTDDDKAMAFDRHAGRIVLLADWPANESRTWTFDVCDNTWQRMAPAVEPPAGRAWLAYDVDSDRTVALVETDPGPERRFEAWVYDLGADTWSQGSDPPPTTSVPYQSSMGGDVVVKFGLLYHDPSGLVVFHDALSLWAYDLRSETWTEVRQGPDPAKASDAAVPGALMILAYDSRAGVVVAYARDGAADAVPWAPGTWLFDPRKGTWRDEPSTVTPELACQWDFNAVCGAVFDPSSDETDFFAGGGTDVDVLGADRTWHTGRRGDDVTPLCLANAAVYDSIDRRVVCRTGDDGVAALQHTAWPTEDWDRSTWLALLEPQASASPAP